MNNADQSFLLRGIGLETSGMRWPRFAKTAAYPEMSAARLADRRAYAIGLGAQSSGRRTRVRDSKHAPGPTCGAVRLDPRPDCGRPGRLMIGDADSRSYPMIDAIALLLGQWRARLEIDDRGARREGRVSQVRRPAPASGTRSRPISSASVTATRIIVSAAPEKMSPRSVRPKIATGSVTQPGG